MLDEHVQVRFVCGKREERGGEGGGEGEGEGEAGGGGREEGEQRMKHNQIFLKYSILLIYA